MNPKDSLIQAMEDLLSEKISVQEFCVTFERVWNFEVAPTEVTETEVAAFQKMFDVATWHGTDEDRKQYPAFKDDDDVKNTARATLKLLREKIDF